MDFSFLPSLQSLAATQIATLLWNQADVVALRADCGENYIRGGLWPKIEKNVNEKVSLLRQPAPLREMVSSLVLPIGDQIRAWKERHVEEFKFKNIPREFCWTSRGMVNKKETAEAFVRDLTLPEGERYSMACLYCIEWDKPVPFQGTESYPLRCFRAFWTYDRTGDVNALDRVVERDTSKTAYQCAFDYAVQYGNEVAAEYYIRKLTPCERKESLSNIKLLACYKDFCIYRFLLLHMSEEQQLILLKGHGKYVLQALLEWPWQQFFLDVAHRVRDILEDYEYSHLLSDIVTKIQDGYEDYNYRELFRTFWMQIPVDQKIDAIFDSSVLDELLGVGDKENFSLMMKELSPEEKEWILLYEERFHTIRWLAHNDKWDLLEFFVCECLSSCDRMIHFKKEYEENADILGSAFFEWLDGLIEKSVREETTDCPVPFQRLHTSPGVSTDHT